MNELFEFPEFEITNKIRLIELFGGIGSQAMALRDIGADFEHYRLVEFDKYPVASYNAIHGTNFVPTDITKIHGEDLGIVETETYTYIMTYSFPFQDLSLAGKRRGMSKGTGTRSGLLWEVERLLEETEELPQVLLMENVPQVISEKNRPDFNDWLAFLKSKGYQNYYQVLNAKDYGVAQNRERCFMVSILSKQWCDFKFPSAERLTKTVKDYLEDEVDEKYYINNEKARKLIADLLERGELPATKEAVDLSTNTSGIKKCATCICAKYDSGIVNHISLNTGVVESKKIPCILNYKGIKKVGNNTAKTLEARDYKGFSAGFDVQNGVNGWEKTDGRIDNGRTNG